MPIVSSCSIVVPVYYGAKTLPELTRRLAAVMNEAAGEYEIIYVNDGSQDDSWQVISALACQYPSVRGINLMRNYGQHNATLCGVRAARYEITVTVDDDLQHPPEEIPALLIKLNEGWDVVYGIPQKRPHSWWRNGFSVLTKRVMARTLGVPTIRSLGAFRAFRTNIRRAFASFSSPDVWLDVLLTWGTSRFATVVVKEEPRVVGESNYDFIKLARVAINMMTGFSTLPLRLASILGFAFTFFGVLVFFYVIFSYLTSGSVEGFPFLASIIALFSGTQLFALGIIGEYLARMFSRSMERPTYAIQETTPETSTEPK
ncbi:MAG TPA: glycosyltransferase family 2 protein [Anaerolineaceae bacterium]